MSFHTTASERRRKLKRRQNPKRPLPLLFPPEWLQYFLNRSKRPARAQYDSLGQSATPRARRPRYTSKKEAPKSRRARVASAIYKRARVKSRAPRYGAYRPHAFCDYSSPLKNMDIAVLQGQRGREPLLRSSPESFRGSD